jgi:hypothetical protein
MIRRGAAVARTRRHRRIIHAGRWRGIARRWRRLIGAGAAASPSRRWRRDIAVARRGCGLVGGGRWRGLVGRVVLWVVHAAGGGGGVGAGGRFLAVVGGGCAGVVVGRGRGVVEVVVELARLCRGVAAKLNNHRLMSQNQCFGSGSGLDPDSIRSVDPNPDPGIRIQIMEAWG